MRCFMFTLVAAVVLNLSFIGDGFCEALKKTVAVFDFKNDSGYHSILRIGRDFSMQLSDALIKSKRFIVLTRKDLDVVMAEQDLARSNRFAKARAAKTGKLIPTQILIKGRITDLQEKTSGVRQSFSFKGISLGGKKSTAHVAVIIQLIDSTTGEIIDSQRVDGQARAGGFSVGYSGNFQLGSSSFKKTPLGKAIQMAIDRAVVYITKGLADVSWRGRVVMTKKGLVYINSGKNAGIKKGTVFSIYREGEALIDPETGMNLGSESEKIGEVKVTQVQDKFSKAQALGGLAVEIMKGDLVLAQ